MKMVKVYSQTNKFLIMLILIITLIGAYSLPHSEMLKQEIPYFVATIILFPFFLLGISALLKLYNLLEEY